MPIAHNIHIHHLFIPPHTTLLPLLPTPPNTLPIIRQINAHPPMHPRPNPPHTLILTLHRLQLPPPRLATRVPQPLGHLPHFIPLQAPHADRLHGAVGVVASYDGVVVRPWGDGDFDGWVGAGEVGEEVCEEGLHASVRFGVSMCWGGDGGAIEGTGI